MRTGDSLSISEKVLFAAFGLEQQGRRPFSAEDLVVAAWREFPDAFGLAGYQSSDGRPLYPDSNRVFVEIMGSKPIRKRGLLVKVGKKMYQLTEAGRAHAHLLSRRRSAVSVEKIGLSREIQHKLKRLISSKATQKYRDGRPDDLTFHDACAFWSISPRSSAIEFNGRIANLTELIAIARDGIRDKAATFEHGGHIVTTRDLDGLLALHECLLKNFGREVQIIKSRMDERA